MNSSNNFTVIGSTEYITGKDIAFAALYAFIVLFGIVGNGVVIAIVRKTPSMHTRTNYLLLNLAVADLLSLIFCPGFYDFALHNVKLRQTLGDFVCKAFAGNAVLSVTVLESIFTLTVIAVERYFSLVKPFNTSARARLEKENVGYAIATTWILASIICLPGFLSNNYDEYATEYPCNRPWTLNKLVPSKKTYIITFCFLCMINVLFNGNTARLVYGWIHGNDVDFNKCLHIKYDKLGHDHEGEPSSPNSIIETVY